MNTNVIAFLLTDRCNASCDICCFQCNPKNRFVMDAETIRACMREAAQMGTVKRFSFTGGEAMLYPELLIDLISYGKREFGIPSTLVSNGFWATDYEKGRKIASRLKDAGLVEVKLSADRFHQRFVPIQAVKNAIRILLELNIDVPVSVMDTGRHDIIRETLEQLRPEIYGTKVVYYPLFLTEQMRSTQRTEIVPEDIATPMPWESIRCPEAGIILLFSDGYMYTCCSQFTFDARRLRIGRIGETPLAEAEKNANRDPILDMVRRSGPSWLAARAKERGLPVKDRYSCSCELCYEMLRNEAFIAEIEPEARTEAQRLRVERFLKQMSGKSNA